MEKNCKGETAQKSIAEMENEVKEFNERMKPIQEWFNAEKRKRLCIAQSSSEHDNTICPICGKKLSYDDCNNGHPLVDACVCGDCDKRYVFPFKMMTRDQHEFEYKARALSFFNAHLDSELFIEMGRRIKSIIANHSDLV